MPLVDNTQPVSGHGVRFSITLDPVGAPGTFTLVGGVVGNLPPFLAPRSVTKSTAHDKGINIVVLGPREHAASTFQIDYVSSDPTHTKLYEFERDGTFFGTLWEFGTGLGSDGGVIRSGYVSNNNFMHEVKEGIRRMETTFEPSGPYWVDGDLIGDAFPET